MYKFYYIIIAVVFFCLGFLGAKMIWFPNEYSLCENDQSSSNDTFQTGWEAAKKRLDETGHYYLINTSAPTTLLSGKINKIGNNSINLTIKPLSPLADPELDERIVEINNSTIIYKNELKDKAIYQQELNEYNIKNQDYLNRPDSPVPMPNKYQFIEANFSDLKLAQEVKIETEDDIREIKKFVAQKITIQ